METKYAIQIRFNRKRAQWGYAWKSSLGRWMMGNRNTDSKTEKFNSKNEAETALPEIMAEYGNSAFEVRIAKIA